MNLGWSTPLATPCSPQAVVQLSSCLGAMANCEPGLGDTDVAPVPADLTVEQPQARRICQKGTLINFMNPTPAM